MGCCPKGNCKSGVQACNVEIEPVDLFELSKQIELENEEEESNE